MSEPIKIGSLSDPHERERLIAAVCQHLCCESDCKTGGVNCLSMRFRDEAKRQLAGAPIRGPNA